MVNAKRACKYHCLVHKVESGLMNGLAIFNVVSGARRSLEGQTVITNSACKCDPTQMSCNHHH